MDQELNRTEKEEVEDNWKLLSNARSIYVLGGVRTGKSCYAFGIAKKLQKHKKVFYYSFPRRDLLRKEGFEHLNNLDELSKTTDAVVVIDECVLTMKGRQEKKNNEEMQKVLTLAGQNNITIIFITQVSQFINRSLECLIDCFVVMDTDYLNLKQGSTPKKMIKTYSTFSPENFRLQKGQFLWYSRNFPVFEQLSTFEPHPSFTDEWSLAYKNEASKTNVTSIKKLISSIKWS